MNNPGRLIKVVLFSILGMIVSCGSFYDPPETKETTVSSTEVFLPMVVSGSSEIDPVEHNILENAGFESGTASWVFHSDGAGQLDVTSPGYESSNAALIKISTPGDNVQLYQYLLTLEPHTRYRLEFSARSNFSHDLSVYLHKHGSPYTNYGIDDFNVDLESSWQTFSTEFTTANFENTVHDARLRFWFVPFGVSGDEFFLDNIVLVNTSGGPISTPAPTPPSGPTSTPPPTPLPGPTSTPVPPPIPGEGNYYYVALDGKSNGDGSIDNPWDLETALSHPAAVRPGDTIWLRGGTYGSGGMWKLNSHLTGTSSNLITVRGYPGEEAVIDGMIDIYGGWTIYRNLRVMNSNTKRSTNQTGSWPDDIYRVTGFRVLGEGNKIINNVIHDQGNCLELWDEVPNLEAYGNVVFNCGWDAPDRGHGHGIYAQNINVPGMKVIDENIEFNNFGKYNVHIYSEGGANRNIDLEGNVSFNGKFLVGGGAPAINISATNGFIYNGEMLFGLSDRNNEDLMVENNFIAGVLAVKWWQDVNVSGNFIWGENVVDLYTTGSLNSYQWDNNTYYATSSNAFYVDSSPLNWDQWKNGTGFDISSSFVNGSPSGVDVFVRPNKYEAKRGNIIIYNWDLNDSVEVDVSGLGLENGDTYVLHNVQNYNEETISGTYDGKPISIPMTGWTIAKPIGWHEPLKPSTFPQFGVFVLTSEP